jgi:hypothetical protein
MPEKLSVRLSSTLHRDLRQAARRRGMTPSAFVRAVLEQVLGQSSTAGAPSVLPLHDALERFMTTLPPDVQQAIRQAVTVTELPLEGVVKALVIAACQPKTTS